VSFYRVCSDVQGSVLIDSVQMILRAMLHNSIARSIICTRLLRGKMHSDWFNGIKMLQGRWQHGEKVGYSYPSGLEKILYKWDIYEYVPLVTKWLTRAEGLLASQEAPCNSQFITATLN
jgi:hypothetical protein